MPAWRRTSRSKPRPVTLEPAKSASRRRNESGFWSITATEWPWFSSDWARVAPARPQPMITKCTTRNGIPPGVCDAHRSATGTSGGAQVTGWP
jgi:hypothetical protein